MKIRLRKHDQDGRGGPLTPEELQQAEFYWIKQAQSTLHSRLERGDFKPLSPSKDANEVIRVGGRVDEAIVSYETRHPALLPTDLSTMELLQVLRRIFSIRGYPAVMLSDNGSQMVGAANELKDVNQLREFCEEKRIQWIFATPAAPHQIGYAEALVKSCKKSLKIAIGEQLLTPFELYTCLLEVANLANQRLIGRIPTDPDDRTTCSLEERHQKYHKVR
ncbi:hypothetical protein ACROYT_G007994 [Oculina patagonica]